MPTARSLQNFQNVLAQLVQQYSQQKMQQEQNAQIQDIVGRNTATGQVGSRDATGTMQFRPTGTDVDTRGIMQALLPIMGRNPQAAPMIQAQKTIQDMNRDKFLFAPAGSTPYRIDESGKPIEVYPQVSKDKTERSAVTQSTGKPPIQQGGYWMEEVVDVDPVTRKPIAGAVPRLDPRSPVSQTSLATSMPDFRPELSGEALLKALPVGDKALVRGLIEGKVDPAKAISLRGVSRERYMKLVMRVNPTFDQRWIDASKALARDATTGSIARGARSMNMLIGHLKNFGDSSTALENMAWQTGNTIENFVKKNIGRPEVTRFLLDAEAVSTELAATFKAGTGTASPTETEIQSWKSLPDIKNSPEQFKAFQSEALKLLASRMMALNHQMSGVKTPEGFSLVSPPAKQILDSMGFDWDEAGAGGSSNAKSLKSKYGLE